MFGCENMNEDERMFNFGLGIAMSVLMLTAALQVCYRVQDKTRARVRADIVKTQQEVAVASANFASYVRPEILRNTVISVYPNAEVISFNKSVAIDELPARE
ncbi:MAG: hypothetical protein LBF28_01655 [Rickettsiales bacterium]|jgi:hypothetical protein|nr:hypothetical protein [Rickettsiales bacterium]